MRQASFLKLNGPTMRHDSSEHALFEQVLQQWFELQMENASHQLWPVHGMLTERQVFSYLWPGRVCGDGDEVIWLALLSHDGQCILVVHLHGSGAAYEAAGQDDGATHLWGSSVCSNGRSV